MDRSPPTTLYSSVANAFTVMDIAKPVSLRVDPDDLLEEVRERLFQQENFPDSWFCLVRDEHQIYGYLAADDEELHGEPIEGCARDAVKPITPDLMVPSSMPVLDLIPLFLKQYFFFVLNRNDVTHVVSFQDIDSLPVKLSLFALLLELESEMIKSIVGATDLPALLGSLPDNRLKKAKELYQVKYQDRAMSAQHLLLCTTFADKKELLKKRSDLYDLLPFGSKTSYDRFFRRVEDVRNHIVHSDSIRSVLGGPPAMNEFISQLEKVTWALVTAS